MKWSRRRVAGMLVVAGIAAWTLASPETVFEVLRARANDPVAFGVLVATLYLVRPALAWPPTTIAAVAGFGFGLAGVPVGLVGAVVTALPVYAAARWFGAGVGESSVRSAGMRFFDATGETRGMTAARLAPFPADVTTIAAAVCGVSLRGLVVGTLVGELPWTIAAVYAGMSLQYLSMGSVTQPPVEVVLGAVVAAALVLAGPTYRSLSRHQNVSEQS